MAQGHPLSRGLRSSGLELTAAQVEMIAEVVSSCSGLSRSELTGTVCELLDFRRPNGRLKTRECRDLLERLDEAGQIRLPEKSAGRPRGSETSIPHTAQGASQEELKATLREVAPVRLDKLRGDAEHALWRELVGRYHYLGFKTAYGASLRYLVRIEGPGARVVGCLQFSSPAWRIAARDAWIGWSDAQRRGHLQQVVSQSRFLILPWVRVRHLASHVLGLSARQIVGDWQEHFGIRPLLLETLVDAQRFSGTCYRAANWIHVGQTSGRGRMDREHQRHGAAPKHVFLYPLVAQARAWLQGGL